MPSTPKRRVLGWAWVLAPLGLILTTCGTASHSPYTRPTVTRELRFCCDPQGDKQQSAGFVEVSNPRLANYTDVTIQNGSHEFLFLLEGAWPGSLEGSPSPSIQVELREESSVSFEVLVDTCDLDQAYVVVVAVNHPSGDLGYTQTYEFTVPVISDCGGGEPPAGSRIAYASDDDGDFEIYSMAPDGSQVKQLTDNEADDLDPSWSPGRTEIAFLSDRDGQPAGSRDLYVLNLDTDAVERLTFLAADLIPVRDPSWSPDGSTIAVALEGPGLSAISIVDRATGDFRDLTQNETGSDRWPTWSPDGSEIAFERDGAILTVQVSGNSQQTPRLIKSGAGAGGPLHEPAWDPDGDRIAVRDAHGRVGLLVLTDDPPLVHDLTDVGHRAPAWSPDGEWLVWEHEDTQRIRMATHHGDYEHEVPGQTTDNVDPDWK